MKYELTFHLLPVGLKGRECHRHGAFGTKAEWAFPNLGMSWPPEAARIRESSMLPFPRVTASLMELPNATAPRD